MTFLKRLKDYWKRRKTLFTAGGGAGVYDETKTSRFHLGKGSLKNLKGIHPELVKVVKKAIGLTYVDFMVIEGMRTMERQRELLRTGKSTTMNSRHLTGHAVDLVALVDGKVDWENWKLYYSIADAMKKSASELSVNITWGGDWKTFKDGPHYQLSWDRYPK